jgi:hypothetical protein
MSWGSEVQLNMLDAFSVALMIDGSTHNFGFSDGFTADGRLNADLTVLWVKNITTEFHLHTHGLDRLLRHDERILMMKASDVPDGASLYANDYLDCDNESFKITSSRLKDGIWNLTLNVLGSV